MVSKYPAMYKQMHNTKMFQGWDGGKKILVFQEKNIPHDSVLATTTIG